MSTSLIRDALAALEEEGPPRFMGITRSTDRSKTYVVHGRGSEKDSTTIIPEKIIVRSAGPTGGTRA